MEKEKTTAVYNAAEEHSQNVIGKKIALARHIAGLNLEQFSNLLSNFGVCIGRAGINRWEVGKSLPNAYQLLAVSKALNIMDLDYFVSQPPEKDLNETGLRKLADYKSDLIATGRYSPREVGRIIEMPVSNLRVSAGTGAFLDDDAFEMVSFPEEDVPSGADFGVLVSGNSMEPVYHDGQIVWVSRCHDLNPGEDGVFVYDGQGYLKTYGERKPDDCEAYADHYGKVRMQPVMSSYNKDYPPIHVSLALPFSVVGRVVR